MSRVFFARQIQYYKSKIHRENTQLQTLQEALNNEQVNQGNKQRLFSLNKELKQWQWGKQQLGNSFLGSLFTMYGMNNNFNNIMGNMGGCDGYNNNSMNPLMMGVNNLFGNILDDIYNAYSMYNDANDMYDDNTLSDMKTNDLEQQISMLNSQIQADTQELKNLQEGEKGAIERGAGKYA